jgi:hypothetical protein
VLSHWVFFRCSWGLLRVLEKLPSLLLYRDTFPLAANGVKQNSCTDRQTRERVRKSRKTISGALDMCRALLHFILKRRYFPHFAHKQLRHKKPEV